MKDLQKQRIAVASVFFMNGFGFANLMARMPEIQTLYGMNNAVLGTVLFCRAAGALFAMPLVGGLGRRFSSGDITKAMALGFVIILPLLAVLPSVGLLAFVLFFLGMSEGMMDVNMNEQAVLIERGYSRPIMSSFHAVFSGGMALGATCGVVMSHYSISLLNHYLFISAFSLVLIFLAAPHFVQTEKKQASATKQPLFLLPTKAILPLGIIAFCCMTGEGSMIEWSALFMKQIRQQTDSFSGIALTSFNAAMLFGRTIGDNLNRLLGQERLLWLDSIAAIAGLTMVVTIPSAWVSLLGFFIVGLGLSTIVPIVYSAAGNTEGVSPSVGIAMATSVGYAGFFVGPPVIGYLAEAFDLRIGLLFTLSLFVIMWFLINRLK
jgi:predicted MFS family arabinose efflux permease